MEAEAEDIASQLWEERITPYREELEGITAEARAIVGPYQNQLAEMDADLQAKLAPLRERAKRLRHTPSKWRGGDFVQLCPHVPRQKRIPSMRIRGRSTDSETT